MGDLGSIPGLGRSPGEGKSLLTLSSVLAWRIPWTVTVHGVTKSPTRLSDFHFHFSMFIPFNPFYCSVHWLGLPKTKLKNKTFGGKEGRQYSQVQAPGILSQR